MSEQRAIFRSGFDNWTLNHPRVWSVETDATGLTDFLHAEVGKIVDAQLKAAAHASADIVTSQDRIAEGIDRVSFGVERVTDALESLQSAFEWGFDELIWQVEQQRVLLQQILEVLQKPLDTQAKELKARADEAYRNGWFDDALSDFLESEKKNRYDFTIHQSLGNIYLFEKKDPEKALRYYEKAAKYARPKSAYHASLALLHIALIKYLYGDYTGACQATSEAIALTPLLFEAHYQHAQYCVNLGEFDEALDHIEKAVGGDRYYSAKVYSEKDFDVMREQYTSLFTKIRDRKRSEAEDMLSKAQKLIDAVESQDNELPSFLERTKTTVNKAFGLMNRGSFLDCFDAVSEAEKALISFSKALSKFDDSLVERISRKLSQKESGRTTFEQEMQDWLEKVTRRGDMYIYPLCSLAAVFSAGFLAFAFLGDRFLFGLRGLLLLALVTSLLIPFGWLFYKRAFKSVRKRSLETKLKPFDDDISALNDRLDRIRKRYRYSHR
jgi:tetratricopeptide (TPR) repeat protein